MIKAYDLLNRYKKLSKEECAANFRINGHTTKIMKQTNTKKLAVAAVFCAVAVAGSLFSFPVFGSKCSPVQHMVNILCAVLLGPGYGLGAAFAAALIRNLLGLGSLILLYLGRLFNLLFFAATGFLTLRRLPFGKTAVFAVYLLPMNLHLVSSLSYDVLITAFCGYFTAVCMDLAYKADRVKWKDVVLLAFLLAVMGPCKMVYGVIAGLCLLIPVKKFGGWGRWTASAAGVLGAFAAAMAAVNLGTVSMYTQAEDSYIAWAGETGYTFAELLHRPLHVLKMCYDTLAWKGTQLFEGMIGGSLGNQDPVLNTPTVIILALCTILVVLALKKPGEEVMFSTGNRLWIWFLALLLLGALMFSMLLAWTPRSASMIEGVQGRYLLPFLPAVLLTFRSSRVVRTGSDDRGLLYAVMMMDLYVAVRIFAVVCLRL